MPPDADDRNRVSGTIAVREDGSLSSEITLDLALGKALTATSAETTPTRWA